MLTTPLRITMQVCSDMATKQQGSVMWSAPNARARIMRIAVALAQQLDPIPGLTPNFSSGPGSFHALRPNERHGIPSAARPPLHVPMAAAPAATTSLLSALRLTSMPRRSSPRRVVSSRRRVVVWHRHANASAATPASARVLPAAPKPHRQDCLANRHAQHVRQGNPSSDYPDTTSRSHP